jgi:hypothetical protein
VVDADAGVVAVGETVAVGDAEGEPDGDGVGDGDGEGDATTAVWAEKCHRDSPENQH